MVEIGHLLRFAANINEICHYQEKRKLYPRSTKRQLFKGSRLGLNNREGKVEKLIKQKISVFIGNLIISRYLNHNHHSKLLELLLGSFTRYILHVLRIWYRNLWDAQRVFWRIFTQFPNPSFIWFFSLQKWNN